MIKSVLKVIRAVLKPIIWLVSGIIIFAVGVSILASIFSLFVTMPFLTYFLPEPNILAYLGAGTFFLTIGIPLVGLLIFVANRIQRKSFRFSSMFGLRWVWLASLFFTIYTAANTAYDFSSQASYVQEIAIAPIDDVISVQMTKEPKNEFEMQVLDYTKVRGGLAGDDISLIVKYTDDEVIRLDKKITSQGSSYENALSNAKNILVNEAHLKDNVLFIPSSFKIPRGKRVRAQRIEYILYVPEGKELDFDKNMYHHLDTYQTEGKNLTWSSFDDYTWRMEKTGLFSSENEKENNFTRSVDFSSIKELNIEGPFPVTIRKGPTYNIKMTGLQQDVEGIEVIDLTGIVNVTSEAKEFKNLRVEISVPDLSSLNADGLTSLHIEGLSQETMEVIYKGRGNLKAYCTISNLELTLSGKCSAELIGSGKTLNLHLLNSSKINAEKYKVEVVNVKSESNRKSSIYASSIFNVEENRKHAFDIYGNPTIELYQ